MYASFFNLREMPFAITPDPSYLYLSARHQEALGHLLYGTGQYGGFVQLTGEVGTGKTTIVRVLLEQKLTGVDVAMIHNPRQSELEFVQSLCDELGVEYAADKVSLKTLIDALNTHLLRSHAAGRRTVLIIDEAQNLPRDVLEQVRLLTNLETAKDKLLRIMLVGQPELSELLARPDLRQLASRITARYHLLPLTEAETGEYLRHRLRVAGSNYDIFDAAAIHEVHRQSRGVPRLINILCDRALLGAYSQGQRRVTREVVHKAAAESLGIASPAASLLQRLKQLPRTPLLWVEGALAVVALLIAVGLAWQTFSRPRTQPAPVATAAQPAAPEAAEAAPEVESAPVVTAPAAPTPTAAVATPKPASTAADLSVLLQSAPPLVQATDRLIRLWDRDITVPRGENVCRALARQNLECFKSSGEWKDLRLLNRPAILSLSTGRGELQHVLLRKLAPTVATIDNGRGTLTVPLEQLDTLWTGDYLLLWHRETSQTMLTPGQRGPDVLWLRQRLASISGKPAAAANSDEFDLALSEQLRRFQQAHGLDADGVVGIRTLIALGDGGAGTPRLDAP